jgi:tellurite resistance protein TerC
MHVSLPFVLAFIGGAVGLLAIDLFVFPRLREEVSPRAALVWTIVWLVVGLSFALMVWSDAGEAYAIKYTVGYLVEKGLTIE